MSFHNLPNEYDDIVYRSIDFSISSNESYETSSSSYNNKSFNYTDYYNNDLSYNISEKISDVSVIVLPKLTAPQCPSFLGKINIYALVSLEFLLTAIKQCFTELSIDYEFMSEECSFKCAAFDINMSVLFNLNIYTADNGANIVEFQRQSGCCMLYAQFWKKIQNFLVDHQVLEAKKVVLPKPMCVIPLPMPCPLASIASKSACIYADRVVSIKNLIEMSQSNSFEMKAEAMQILFTLSDSEANHNVIIDAGGVEALLRCIQSNIDDCCRSAPTCLANLFSSKVSGAAVIGIFIKNDGMNLLCKLMSNTKRVQVLREVIRMMKNISECPCGLNLSAQQKDIFNAFLANQDDALIQEQGVAVFKSIKSM